MGWRDKLARAGQRRKQRPRPGRRALSLSPGASADPLHGVAFGSKQAKDDAEAAGLNWLDFADSTVVPSGVEGYLVEDVKEIAEQAKGG